MFKKLIVVIASIFLLLNVGRTQETITKTLLHGGLTRAYIVYVPAIYDDTTPAPLMFNFHGYTGTAGAHMDATGMRQVADTAGFILVYPQGSLLLGSSHWNVGSWTLGSTTDDLGFTEAMITALASTYNLDLSRVYSCGYSNGGYFSFELACQLSARIAAIGSVGGKMSSETYNSCRPEHPIPVVTIHGTRDNVVTYEGSQPVASKSVTEVNDFWIDFNNTDSEALFTMVPDLHELDGSTVEHYAYHNGKNCTSVEHYKVLGGGHDWPGAWGNKDIDASSLIWDFVSQYDINGLISCSTTAVEQSGHEADRFRVYPNPVRESLNISTELAEIGGVEIYSSLGRPVRRSQVRSAAMQIDVSTLLPGIYLLRVGTKTVKLVKTQ